MHTTFTTCVLHITVPCTVMYIHLGDPLKALMQIIINQLFHSIIETGFISFF